MRKTLGALAACPLFEGVDGEDMRPMLDCMGARVVDVDRGGVILSEDGPADRVGILLSGAARVQRGDYDGNRTIRAALRPGDLFGETFACAGVPRLPVSVEASQPCRVMLIPLSAITRTCERACASHSRVLLNLLRVMAEKNLLLSQKLEITSRRTTREKLMAYLFAQARRAGSGCFTIPFDRQGLADYLGVDRSALSAEIGKLRREGVIESERSAFRLIDIKDGLQRYGG
ncbi:MAG: Crp/Fnr family transcriptional regulator [Clostridia bacterium]|nr:Crp/Fnr family transcriptional regulator [Clostridia bacterium]